MRWTLDELRSTPAYVVEELIVMLKEDAKASQG